MSKSKSADTETAVERIRAFRAARAAAKNDPHYEHEIIRRGLNHGDPVLLDRDLAAVLAEHAAMTEEVETLRDQLQRELAPVGCPTYDDRVVGNFRACADCYTPILCAEADESRCP